MRQLSAILFRIGELEYEIVEDAVHSPEPDESFRQWIFKDPGCPDAQRPENTRLQLAGNTFHAAHGTLNPDPFR